MNPEAPETEGYPDADERTRRRVGGDILPPGKGGVTITPPPDPDSPEAPDTEQ